MDGNIKHLVFGVCVAFVLLGAFVSVASATTWYVEEGDSIQAAVDAASDGDVIIARDGTYTENVDVNTPHLTIKSENGSDLTVIQAVNPDNYVFEVTADYVNISGFTVKGATEDWKGGIFLYGVKNCYIFKNNASNNYYGIKLRASTNSTIRNNIVSENNFHGIVCYYSNSNFIENNKAIKNNRVGIYLDRSSNNNIKSNSISHNRCGLSLGANSNNNTIENNTVSDNNYHGIYLHNSSYNIIINNNALNNSEGIWLYHGSCNNKVVNNTVLRNDNGIRLSHLSNNNALLSNNALNNTLGINLDDSSNNTLTNNNFNSNRYGIRSPFSNNNKIYLNNFINNTNITEYYYSKSFNIFNSTGKISHIYKGNTYTNYLGNYWDDYEEKYPDAEEIDETGIWDTPYSIDGDKDYYPLVEGFENYIRAISRGKILVDASRDGGVWWYPQTSPFEPNKDHQGKALADYLRSLGYEVTELPRLDSLIIDSTLLNQYTLVIMANEFGREYSLSEISAYKSYIENNGGKLLLLEDHDPGGTLTSAFGLEFAGTSRGENVVNRFIQHPITNNVSQLYYGVGSGLISYTSDALIILGWLSNNTYLDLNDNEKQESNEPVGAPVLGCMHYGKGKIIFFGDTNTIEGVPQPFVDNIISWLLEEITQPPIASFTYSPENPIANQNIVFDASNSTDPDGTITNYEWNFGDNTIGFGKVTTHSYAKNGTYTVNLTVTDDKGATNSSSKEITIGKIFSIILRPPFELGYSAGGKFEKRSSCDYFNFTDKNTGIMKLYTSVRPEPIIASGKAQAAGQIGNTIHISEDGFYQINTSFFVNGTIGADCLNLLGLPICSGSRITLSWLLQDTNGSYIIPPETILNSYVATFELDRYPEYVLEEIFKQIIGAKTGIKIITPSEDSKAIEFSRPINGTSIQYLEKGDYKIFAKADLLSTAIPFLSLGEVTVYSDFQSDDNYIALKEIKIERVFDVTNAPPIAKFTPTEKEVKINELITFDASESKDYDGEITEYYWEFEGASPSTAYFKMGTVLWHNPGVYTVKLKVKDDSGVRSGFTYGTITVKDPSNLCSPLNKNAISIECPVNATITDQYGRIIADDGTNEIPAADMLITNETKIFYLPADLTYSTEIDAYDTGTFNFTRVSPIGTDISLTKFENISVTTNTNASVEIVPSETNYTMSIDYDGDGETDEVKNPDVDETIIISPTEENIFDTGSPANPYPSIFGTHNGTIKPNQTITVNKLYTYSCVGTGGHTEYAKIRNATWNATATWEGYAGDWHNITFDKTVVLLANETYNYTIRTGSYPQIHHKPELPTANGWINCTEFTDANGKIYTDWVPAIRLW